MVRRCRAWSDLHGSLQLLPWMEQVTGAPSRLWGSFPESHEFLPVQELFGQRKFGFLHLFEAFSLFQFGCQHEVGATVPPGPDATVSRSTVLVGSAWHPTAFQLQSCHLTQQHNKPVQHDIWFVQASAENEPEVQL